ncbi:hypothetical protein D9M68_692990 [compost metagenome]
MILERELVKQLALSAWLIKFPLTRFNCRLHVTDDLSLQPSACAYDFYLYKMSFVVCSLSSVAQPATVPVQPGDQVGRHGRTGLPLADFMCSPAKHMGVNAFFIQCREVGRSQALWMSVIVQLAGL